MTATLKERVSAAVGEVTHQGIEAMCDEIADLITRLEEASHAASQGRPFMLGNIPRLVLIYLADQAAKRVHHALEVNEHDRKTTADKYIEARDSLRRLANIG